jgi:hypothetical protein
MVKSRETNNCVQQRFILDSEVKELTVNEAVGVRFQKIVVVCDVFLMEVEIEANILRKMSPRSSSRTPLDFI